MCRGLRVDPVPFQPVTTAISNFIISPQHVNNTADGDAMVMTADKCLRSQQFGSWLLQLKWWMVSPVGTTYELRSHSLLPVGPRMTDKADSCGELSTAVITGKASCICGLGCADGLTCRTFPSAALLYCSGNTNFLKLLHPGEASFLPFRSVAS